MLQLPDAHKAARHSRGAKGRDSESANERAAIITAAFPDLEAPIGDAKVMASIACEMTDKLVRNVIAFQGMTADVTADQMSRDLSDILEQVTFAAYQVEKMLHGLEDTYQAIAGISLTQEQR